MSEPSSVPRNQTRAPTAEDVVAFLRRHPTFLDDHPELLTALALPGQASGDNIVDLKNFMIERLGREVDRLKASQSELIATARGNITSQSRIHAAVLDILAARSFEHLIESVTTDLAVRLDVDVVSLCVECDRDIIPAAARTSVRALQPGTIDEIMGDGLDTILRSDITAERAVFGALAGLVKSDALLRLSVSPVAPTALLALGSRDPHRFEPGHGTELLGFLAGVLESTIRSWLDLPG